MSHPPPHHPYQRYPHQFSQPIPAATAPSNMATQRFCLRWNNHQSNLLSVFDQLLHEQSFVDVTLAVDGQLLKAHKMVLSACSPYFQNLFINHPDKHPIVILKDVSYADMKSLLDFMYRGEVSVDQDRLTHFLRVAESLRIKGLTEVNEEKCDNIANSLSQQQNHRDSVPSLQKIQQNKRFAAQNAAPSMASAFNMLGSYLMQPKRKRGRPRRLSGTSNPDESPEQQQQHHQQQQQQQQQRDALVRGSPEMLEVKMGMDNFADHQSDGSTSKEEEEPGSTEVKVKEEESESEIGGAGTSRVPGDGGGERRSSEEGNMQIESYVENLQENNQNHSNIEMVTVKQETVIISTEEARNLLAFEEIKVEPTDILEENPPMHTTEVSVVSVPLEPEISTGVHFLTDEPEDPKLSDENYERKKLELLAYMPQSDGSVVCKHCGEVLPSRTHWYRHKYKVHVAHFGNPSPLFKCEQCNVFFKSRRGYLGHYSSRHPQQDSNESTENGENVLPKEDSSTDNSSSSPPYNSSGRRRSFTDKTQDWEEQRIKEEKLVSDIINRVKKECEAQGEMGSRRGYTRRTTSVMNSYGD